MVYGYARVSTKEQNLQLQLDALKRYGVDRIYKDKVSTKKIKREQLEILLSALQSGDTIVIWKLDRLGRSLRQLLDLVDDFEKQNVNFVSLNEMIDTKSPVGRVFFAICAAFAQFERETISMRTIAGLDAARAQGRFGGRPPKDKKSIDLAIKLYKSGFSVSEIEKTAKVSPHTMYKYLRLEVIELYCKGIPIDEIAEITKYKRESIERTLDKIENDDR